MLQFQFLTLLDDTLRTGCGRFSQSFIDRQLAFVKSKQTATGGFTGRKGPADLYYTDFACRSLHILNERRTMATLTDYLESLPPQADVVGCFNRLNIARMLGLAHHAEKAAVEDLIDEKVVKAAETSAYDTFLAGLCCEMSGADSSWMPEAAQRVLRLQRPDGGFGERRGDTSGEANATAAAVAFLTFAGEAEKIEIPAVAQFLASLQHSDGGIAAHPAAPSGDLLSTFSVLVTLGLFEMLEGLDLPAVGRFIKNTAAPTGGFKACSLDDAPDIEYTYYGVASLALLHAHILEKQREEK